MVVASEVSFPASDPRGSSLEWVTEVFRHAATGVGVAEVVDTLWVCGRRALDLDLLAVGDVDAAGRVHWLRWRSTTADGEGRIEPVVSAAIVDRVVERVAPWVVDLASEQDRLDAAGLHLPPSGDSYRGCALVPMRAAGRVVGVTVAATSSAHAWSDDQLRLLELCCGRLAAMVDRERLDESLRTAAARLEETGRDLERLTMLDPLTGLPTRTALEAQLELEWRRAWRVGRPLSLLVAEIDDFAGYRERFGTDLADRCVNQVAGELARGLRRAGDFTARIGDTAFAVLLPGAAADDASRTAERARAGVEGLRIPNDAGNPVRPWLTVSMGIATVTPSAGCGPHVLMEAADQARQDAIHDGRNRVRWREPSVEGVSNAGPRSVDRRRSSGTR
jgi:diguanylate cyclase (GGDEF)-like protein